ncbi:hypothetical protein NMY22_g16646 [Coprinellus aureogranulatus]|nr:hypothetical protein NMY22_g16646 [Coprinellus aureogranulatus]
MVATYLHRSGSAPINLFLETSEYDSLPYSSEIRQLHASLVQLLYPTSARWEHVDLHVSIDTGNSPLLPLLAIAPANVPNVRSVRLEVECSSDMSFMMMFLPGFDPPAEQMGTPLSTICGVVQSSSLTNLTVRATPKKIIWMMPIAWKQLTYLVIGGGLLPVPFTQLDAMIVMANCPNLIECEAHFREERDILWPLSRKEPEPLPVHTVTLSDLRVLRLAGENPPAQELPSRLSLPSLTSLSINHSQSYAPRPDAKSVHIEWINEHGENLSFVDVDYASLTPSGLLRCLERLPNVVELRLLGRKYGFGGKVDDELRGSAALDVDLLARLTPRFNEAGVEVIEPCLCPKLKRIECIMCAEEPENEEAFLNMVRARYGDGMKKWRGSIRRIEEVVLDYNRPPPIDGGNELERWAADRFHLALTASYKEREVLEGGQVGVLDPLIFLATTIPSPVQSQLARMTTPSPFAHRLKTTTSPRPKEAHEIATLVEARLKLVEEVKAKLDKLEVEYEGLLEQLNEHNEFVDDHKALLSPFRQIPDDILVLIFLAARRHSSFASVTISHVCRLWRDLAFRTPDLWSEIAFSPKQHPIFESISVGLWENMPAQARKAYQDSAAQWKDQSKKLLDRVSTYISRSGTQPLSVSVACYETLNRSHPSSASIEEILESLVEILLPTSTRWRVLELNISIRKGASPLLRLLPTSVSSAPILKSLSLGDLSLLHVGDGDEYLTGSDYRKAAESLASLTSLTLISLGTKAVLTSPSLSDHAITVLEACPNLVLCSLEFGYPHYPPVPGGNGRKATLSQLQELQLCGAGPATRGFGSRLLTPSLTRLTVALTQDRPEELALVHLLERYGHQLADVSFDYRSLDPPTLLRCLSLLPNVVRLRLVGHTERSYHTRNSGLPDVEPSPAFINDDVVSQLTPMLDPPGTSQPRATRTLCPNLKRLECMMGSLERSEEAFREFIKARCGSKGSSIRRIEEVVLHYDHSGPREPRDVDIVRDISTSIDVRDLALEVHYGDHLSRLSSEGEVYTDYIFRTSKFRFGRLV